MPGDIVVLEAGDLIPADLYLIHASKLEVDEGALTGESMPVGKSTEALPRDAALSERTNMAFKGTAVTRGSAEGVVLATGINTELGKISSLVKEAKEEITPLEKRLNQLGHNLIWSFFGIATVVAIAGILSEKKLSL